MRAHILLLLACVWASGTPGTAAELELSAPIVAVTVYPDRAEVTRRGTLAVPAGAHTILLRGLPADLDQRSLRVEGGLELGAVQVRQRFASQTVVAAERALDDAISGLRDRIGGLDDKIATARLQIEMVAATGQALARGSAEEIRAGTPDPAGWARAWAALGEGADGARERIRTAEREKRRLAAELDARQRELDTIRTGRRSAVDLEIAARMGDTGPASVALRYQIAGASWQPGYEARLDSSTATLALAQHATIEQRTGEAWENVTAVLATARPATSTELPRLEPWLVDVLDPAQPRAAARPAPASVASVEARRELAAAPALDRAAVVATDFAASWAVPGTVTIPGDGSTRVVPLATEQIRVDLLARLVPRVDPHAHLLAAWASAQAGPLLPGEVGLYIDGSFAGTGELPLLRQGERAELGFGADDRIEVDYRQDTAGRSTEGIIRSYRRQERRWLLTAVNRRQRPIRLEIVEHQPVPQDERITVEALDAAQKPSRADLDGRKGVIAWDRELQPGGKVELRWGFAVTAPESLRVTGF